MPRPRSKEKVVCQFYTWLLGRRDGVWQADGRSNRPDLRRHSLGTGDYEEARRLLAELDVTMAVRHGRADPSALAPARYSGLPLERGRQLYMDFVGRPRVAGGVRPSSLRRYEAVFDKFQSYAQTSGLTTRDNVTTDTFLG
jgi:hypothetical protein